tara:strand:- start:150 stop:434 length:285 start_codon:yes stop_codon:yes gene_type:complete
VLELPQGLPQLDLSVLERKCQSKLLDNHLATLQRMLRISFARWQHPILSEALPLLPLALPLIRWQQSKKHSIRQLLFGDQQQRSRYQNSTMSRK